MDEDRRAKQESWNSGVRRKGKP